MDRRYVRLDPRKLDFLRLKRGWNLDTLFAEAAKLPYDLAKRTVKHVIQGEPAFVKSAKALAELLGAEDLVSVSHPDVLSQIIPPGDTEHAHQFLPIVGEWELVDVVSAPEQTANGLRFDRWKMRHRQVPGRWGAGKCYDLSGLGMQELARVRGYLTRHSQICDTIGPHPHIVQNRDAIAWSDAPRWWIIDEWVEGDSLGKLLASKQLPSTLIPAMLRQVASGLTALHAAQIVRRELSPRFIRLRQSDRSVVLTDFELAKLLASAPTVAPQSGWPDDPYRAPEVDADQPLDARADVYSWGRILVHAVCGELPPPGEEATLLAAARLPAAIRRLATACVALPPSARPVSFDEISGKLKKWT